MVTAWGSLGLVVAGKPVSNARLDFPVLGCRAVTVFQVAHTQIGNVGRMDRHAFPFLPAYASVNKECSIRWAVCEDIERTVLRWIGGPPTTQCTLESVNI